VFNAYDADATRVIVDTDAPRFQRMSIRDNGLGMNSASVAHLIKHIGGSSKRTYKGVELGTVNQDDPDLSPSGRDLIGKIGIGLFAVVHLTNQFRIITKQAGELFRIVVDVRMRTHTEENLRHSTKKPDGTEEFVTGDVAITLEKASDIDSHGTEIILLQLRKTTRDILRTAERWEALLQDEEQGSKVSPLRPKYHIGYADIDEPAQYIVEPEIPWDYGVSDQGRFESFFRKVVDSSGSTAKNPDLESLFDNYFETIWRVSLAAPLPYLHQHPFNITGKDGIDLFILPDVLKGKAASMKLGAGECIADAMQLESVRADPCGGFSVVVDGIELRRPVELPGTLLNKTGRVRAKQPMFFVGKCKTSLGDYPAERSGGALEFEAYFYWNSLIVPNQNRGVLVRIHGASGVLYDDRFMDYQVAELNRLKQLTAEVFILRGMDPALNIDRESFNVSHPHYQYLTKWVHHSLRQITNRLKEVGKRELDKRKQEKKEYALGELAQRAEKIWQRSGDELESMPEIEVIGIEHSQKELSIRGEGGMVFHLPNRDMKFVARSSKDGTPPVVEQAKSIMAVLTAHRLLDGLPYAEQQVLFEDVVAILSSGRLDQ
jgi:hypothetical protein